ncbi:hypothetical protein CPB83DRAFT_845732 [Crepidotus variabilis]|uniref:Uncharacterized protein n=1 Tax=Crepidotus variabilis TaxID=179855 RepID=A0A9P6EQG0_9AGAR|nr:hypothetical protein CPB83DRAFT_845732 [Crepidotus variabilis]
MSALYAFFLLLLYVVMVSAQGDLPFTFYNVSIFNGDGGHFNGIVKVGGYLQVVVNSSSVQQFYVSHPGTIELWSGTNTSTDSTIVDVIGTSLAPPVFEMSCGYTVPNTLTTGKYHVRVHVEGETAIGKSATFPIVTGDFAPPCEEPPSYRAISSTSDSRYTSMRIYKPRGGQVFDLSPSNISFFDVKWFYVDYRNYGNVGVTNATVELLNEDTLQTVALGPLQLATGDNSNIQKQFSINNLAITPGAWRVRGNYTNKVENNGRPVSALSELFYVHPANASCGQFGPVKTPTQSGTERSRRAVCRLRLCFVYLSLSIIYQFL